MDRKAYAQETIDTLEWNRHDTIKEAFAAEGNWVIADDKFNPVGETQGRYVLIGGETAVFNTVADAVRIADALMALAEERKLTITLGVLDKEHWAEGYTNECTRLIESIKSSAGL